MIARAPSDSEVAAAVAEAHHREWAFVLAATVRVTRDLDLAEECVQDAYAKALTAWATGGIPASSGAWLTTVAKRGAIDALRRGQTAERALPLLLDDRTEPPPEEPGSAEIHDDRLQTDFHVLSPLDRPRRAGRADAAAVVRAHHR